jgi:hypothetical protein
VTYDGVLAPRHRLRNPVIPQPPGAEPRQRLCTTPAKGTSRWHAWLDLLWRVFELDGLSCVCGGRLTPTRHCSPASYAPLHVFKSLERSAKRQPRVPPLCATRVWRPALVAWATTPRSRPQRLESRFTASGDTLMLLILTRVIEIRVLRPSPGWRWRGVSSCPKSTYKRCERKTGGAPTACPSTTAHPSQRLTPSTEGRHCHRARTRTNYRP